MAADLREEWPRDEKAAGNEKGTDSLFSEPKELYFAPRYFLEFLRERIES